MKQTRASRSESSPPAVALNPFQDFANSACLLLDSGGVILEANPEAARLLGRPARELTGSSFGVCLQESTRTLVDVVSPYVPQKVITVRAVPAHWSPQHAIVILETADPAGGDATLAQVAHLTVAEAQKNAGQSIRFSLVQVPELPAIPEAHEIFERCLAFLRTIAGADEGEISILGIPVSGNRALVVFRLTTTDPGSGSSPVAPWGEDPFALVEQVGGKLTCLYDFPVTTLQLRIPNGEAQPVESGKSQAAAAGAGT